MFDWLKEKQVPRPRKGMPSPRLGEAEFKDRFRSQFLDPNFNELQLELDKLVNAAWDAYAHSRKSPQTRKAGPQFIDPEYDLALDWLAAHNAIELAQRRHDDTTLPLRILLINASSRSEHTCPGEMSKSYRLVEIARDVIAADHEAEIEILDLSRLTSEYGRNIHP